MEKPLTIAILWQCFLSYHLARIKNLKTKCLEKNINIVAIEVSSGDNSYGFPSHKYKTKDFNYVCCFPDVSYHSLDKKCIYKKVFDYLDEYSPDIVFAPATPFPEGMAAYLYRTKRKKKAIMMDDAWCHTDQRGLLTKVVKRLIHRNIDGVFIPAPSHRLYYAALGFPSKRVVYGVDAVDNEFFFRNAELARRNFRAFRSRFGLPEKHFLFVGRFLPRKGLETLLTAYGRYRLQSVKDPWDLVLVGTGTHLGVVKNHAAGIDGIHFAGPQFGEDLCHYYGSAGALVVPSERDPWALVVNEGMAAGLPVIVSTGCGAAKTLMCDGENGWSFSPGDVDGLTWAMLNMGTLSDEGLAQMGEKSRAIISNWSLDRFADGVMRALNIPRREPAGFLSNLLTRFWKGRISLN